MTTLQQLRDLREQPDARAALATALLAPSADRQTLQAALDVLARTPHPPARPALVELFHHFANRGPTLDPGTTQRTRIVKALRPIAQPPDAKLFERAAATYEWLPPHFLEEAQLLRANGLVALSEQDDELARFHATRLLADPYTDGMSGEPALSAARVLGVLDELLPLYFYAMQNPATLLPEVASECLRNLTALPESLLPNLLARYTGSEREQRGSEQPPLTAQPIILLGLFDLLLHHETGPHEQSFLWHYLHAADDLDVYRYLVAAIAAMPGDRLLLPALLDEVRFEQNRDKVFVLLDALAVVAHDKQVGEVLAQLEGRVYG